MTWCDSPLRVMCSTARMLDWGRKQTLPKTDSDHKNLFSCKLMSSWERFQILHTRMRTEQTCHVSLKKSDSHVTSLCCHDVRRPDAAHPV